MYAIPLDKGGQAHLVSLEGDRGTITSPSAAAPGSRLAMKVDGRSIRLKVHSCKRHGEHFTISGRFIDLTRDLRDRLMTGLASATPAGDL